LENLETSQQLLIFNLLYIYYQIFLMFLWFENKTHQNIFSTHCCMYKIWKLTLQIIIVTNYRFAPLILA
jgi:hypothetical protein